MYMYLFAINKKNHETQKLRKSNNWKKSSDKAVKIKISGSQMAGVNLMKNCLATISVRVLQWLKRNNSVIMILIIFFLSGFSFPWHSRFTGQQGKGEAIFLVSHYKFHQLHEHWHISQTITGESSPLHITSGRIRTENL